MNDCEAEKPKPLPRPWVPWFVVLLSLAATFLATTYVRMASARHNRELDSVALGIFLGGLAVSGILFITTWAQRSARLAVERSARDLRASEQALRRSELRYRSLVDASTQVVWSTDPEGRPRGDLPGWRNFTGQTREQMADRGWLDAVHPDDRQRVLQVWERALSAKSTHAYEFRLRAADGTWRDVSARAVPVIDAEGRLCEWVGAITDVTGRKRAEQATQFMSEATAALSSDLDYQSTLQTVAQLAVPRLADWCAVDVLDEKNNPRRLAIVHSDPAKARRARELQQRYPPGASGAAGLAEVLRTGQSQFYPTISDEMLQAAARDYEHLAILRALGMGSAIIAPLTARGHILGALTLICAESGYRYTQEDVVFAEELARRAGMAVDNARLYAEAQEANRLKDEFLAIVSHELRTPVNAILGWTQLLRAGALEPAALDEALTMIESSARTLGQLIGDLLDITRITRDTLRIGHESVDLREAVSEAIASVLPLAKGKHLQFEQHIGAPGKVTGDAARLQQVASHLLNNAVKFTPEFGRVDVELDCVDHHARLRVSDTGRGIGADFLPHVFDGLRQVEASSTRKLGGLGLSLAIARHLVRLHGGTLSAASDGEGRGSTFTMLIPLEELTPAK